MAYNQVKNYLIIGISGVTNGGKTMLCEYLSNSLGSRAEVMNMDRYFYPDFHPSHIRLPEFNGHANWEALEAVNLRKMHQDIESWVRKVACGEKSYPKPVLLVEGILIFNYKPLLNYYDKKYFFTLTKDQCWERRRLRTYIPPDPAGYFDGIVWPMYLKNKEALVDERDFTYLDGADDMENICKTVSNDIEHLSTY